MNTHEAWKGTIMGEEGECAAFVIDTVASPFLLSGITKPGEQYTFSFWGSSDAEGNITVGGKTFPITGEWTKYDVTFTAEGTDLPLYFNAVGTYYVFRPQLEIGSIPSDYVPAPEDTDESIDAANQNIESVRESVAQLSLDAESIRASVSQTEGKLNNVSGELEKTNENVAALELTAKQAMLDIQYISEEGVGKVANTTGTFDKSGLTVDNSESPTRTTITPDGMKVYRKSGSANEAVLSATSAGVDATNLHAKTYLIVGGRSRFENYGMNRTGLFWIGDVT